MNGIRTGDDGMASPTDFAKMVPGFDFLQGLMRNAGAGLPPMSQWIAPTLDPEELGKRIEELRTVQFWLEQNAKLLGTTIQALEVQRMTLSTLKTMNLPLADLRDALTLPPAKEPAPSPAAPPPGQSRSPRARRDAKTAAARSARSTPSAQSVKGAALVDPMQWWGALTQQFTDLAAKALRDGTTDAARNLAGSMMKQSIDSAGETLKKAASVASAPVKAAKVAARAGRAVAEAGRGGGRRRR
jgi:hypothetical protein